MRLSLIITTYNWPSSLELVLKSVEIQTILPEAPTEPIVTPSEPIEAQVSPIPEPPTESEVTFAFPEPPQQVTSETSHDDNDNDWLARMEAQ